MRCILQHGKTRHSSGAVPFGYGGLPLLSLVLLSLATGFGAETANLAQDVISGIDQAQKCREQKLMKYTVTEDYTVRNSHFDKVAELKATVLYRKGLGKTYKVVSRTGPGVLQRRVLDRILAEDTVLSRDHERSRSLLTSANYLMSIQGIQTLHGKRCYVIGLRPKGRSLSLIEGKAWVDSHDFSLLRIQGRPSVSPSFWTGRPFIEREYTLIDGFSFPRHSRATSKGFFTGKSELDIEYSEYSISFSPESSRPGIP